MKERPLWKTFEGEYNQEDDSPIGEQQKMDIEKKNQNSNNNSDSSSDDNNEEESMHQKILKSQK